MDRDQLTGDEVITVSTTPQGERDLEAWQHDTPKVPMNLFEAMILNYIHNFPNHTATLRQPVVQIGTKGVAALNYLADNNLIEIIRH